VGIVQQNTGTAASGTSFTASLLSASSASNCVVIVVAGSTTITTPASWTLRTSQVANMGHYWFERSGVSVTSQALAGGGASPETWWMFEIASGVHQTSTGQNAVPNATTYNTPSITPTSGTKILLASIGSQMATGSFIARTVSGWTSSFVEQIDVCEASGDYPMQGGAILPDFTADGTTAYSTTATFSSTSSGRSALIGSYTTTAGAAVNPLPEMAMAPIRR
jgi:hypothetical protein